VIGHAEKCDGTRKDARAPEQALQVPPHFRIVGHSIVHISFQGARGAPLGVRSLAKFLHWINGWNHERGPFGTLLRCGELKHDGLATIGAVAGAGHVRDIHFHGLLTVGTFDSAERHEDGFGERR
jgi:hypothetical protein